MKLRESGMPDEELWEQFFNPDELFKKFGLIDEQAPGADLACGFGTFTIPLAKLNKKTIYAVDIDKEYLNQIEKKMKEENLTNIKLLKEDISDAGFELPEKVNFALLFNILHCEKPEEIITNASRNLIKGGRIYIIHWRSDIETPRGPPLAIRPKMEEIIELMKRSGYEIEKQFKSISTFHYGLSCRKITM